MIEIKNLYKSFNDTVVLEDINLKINESSVFGLVGINGAGKSTLLRCLSGIYKADQGACFIDGEDVFENEKIKKDLLLVSDDPYFSRNSTIGSIKKYYESFYEFNNKEFYKYLDLLKLDPKKPINNFSKGMRRQVFLLMALSVEPKILILDEAFDGLDPLARLNFKKALSSLIENNNSTIIISSHNLKELEDICESYAILDNHKILMSGDLDEKKAIMNKYQIVFNEEKTLEDFKEFNIFDSKIQGRVINLIISGNKEETLNKLNQMKPILLETLPLDFEEIFISELERKGTIDVK